MARTLYGVLEGTLAAIAELRACRAVGLDDNIRRFEAAVRQALDASGDGVSIALANEYAALNALCDLHLALQSQPESVRATLRPIVDDWIAYAVSRGLTPEEWDRAQPNAERHGR